MSLRRLTWTAYLLMVCQGYLFYAVGYGTPYLQSELGAPAWASALPNSAMAIGLLVSGVVANRVVRRLGAGTAIRLWIGLMVAAAVLLSLAVSIWPVVAGALLCGIAGAGILVHVITTLADRRDGVLLMRAVLWSVMGGVIGPIALSTAARTVGWSIGALVPVPLLLALAVIVPGSPARDAASADGSHEPPLGRAYWLTWTYLVLCIAAEFSFVAWGAQVAVEQAGLALADATALGSLFVLGEILGRLALSTGIGTRVDVRVRLLGSTLLGAAGCVLLWLAGVPALAGAGMLIGGLGMAAVFPLSTGLAVAHAPTAPVKAGTRITAASGVAIISAPLLLGVVAGVFGVISAWALVLALLVAALIVLRLIPRPPDRAGTGATAGSGATGAVAEPDTQPAGA
jgi:MFS family permease